MRALRKDFWMEIRKSKARFISIFLIVALGVAFFSGIQASSPDMRYSGDAYYDSVKLMNIKVVGTLGLTQDDVSALEAIDGIEGAEGAYSTDVLCGAEQAQKVLHVESVTDTVNFLTVDEGKVPDQSGEIFLDKTFASAQGYALGDTITLTQSGDSELLLVEDYTVAGIGSSPLYISFNRGNTTLGSGEINGFAYVSPQDFDQEVYTQIYLTVHGAENLTSYTDAYENLIEKIQERVEGIEEERCQIRYDSVMADAREEIEDARQELEDGRQEADEELADAWEELEDARTELTDGKEEIMDGQKELADAREELANGREELFDAWAEVEDGWDQLEDAKKELEDGKSQLEDAKKELEDGQKQIDDARKELESGKSQLADARQQVADGQKQLADAKSELEDGWAQVNEKQAEITAGKQQLAEARQQYTDGQKQIEEAKVTLDEKQAEIDAGQKQLDAGKAELTAAKAELEPKREQCQAGLDQVEQGEAQLAQAQTELNASREQLAGLQSQLNGLQSQLAASQQQLAGLQSQYEVAAEAEEPSQETLAGLQEQITSVQSQIGALQEQINQLSPQITSYQAAVDSGAAELEAKRQQLAATRSELEAGMASIEAGYAQISQKETELAASQKQLADGQAEIDSARAQIAKQEAELPAAQEEIEKNEQALIEGQAQLEEAKKNLYAGQAKIDASEAELADAKSQISANAKKIASGEAEIAENEQKLLDGKAEIAENEQKLLDGEAEIKENEQKLLDAETEIEENEQKLIDGQKEIWENEQALTDAIAEWNSGESEFKDGLKEYQDGKQEAEEKIADGEQKLADAQQELDDLEVPQWIITDRNDLPEYSDYGDNADRIRNLGKVFPVIFFLVAALISLTTMTRMVEDQRTQIGTMKALGYGKFAIASKYLGYALLATVGGSILGILIGEKIIPYIIITAYGIMYHNMASSMQIDYELKFALIASGASILCTMAATIFSCYKSLMETPASLMRPPAPKEGKRILLERIGILWKHLNFSWKSSLRNLFRYKKRLFMTIFGIAGSVGLMLVGFGIQDSIMDIAVRQYDELQHYEATIIGDEDATEAQKQELLDYLQNNEEIDNYNRIQLTKMELPRGKSNLSAYVFVPEDLEKFKSNVTLQNRKTKETYELTQEGAVICEKTASLLDLQVGDYLTLKKDNQEYQVKISVITENYMGHYVYLSRQAYVETFGEEPEFTNIVFAMKEEYEDQLEQTGNEILEYPAALSISYTSSLAGQLERMLSTLDSVILVLIVSAGMLAFVVLYNLNNINITERQRELATLKVLGFYDGEVSQYVFRENILLTLIGIVVGSFFGIFLHRYVITTVEVDAVMFGRNIKPLSYVYSGLFTFGFSMFVNGVMHFKLKKIDMVESLKSVE